MPKLFFQAIRNGWTYRHDEQTVPNCKNTWLQKKITLYSLEFLFMSFVKHLRQRAGRELHLEDKNNLYFNNKLISKSL